MHYSTKQNKCTVPRYLKNKKYEVTKNFLLVMNDIPKKIRFKKGDVFSIENVSPDVYFHCIYLVRLRNKKFNLSHDFLASHMKRNHFREIKK